MTCSAVVPPRADNAGTSTAKIKNPDRTVRFQSNSQDSSIRKVSLLRPLFPGPLRIVLPYTAMTLSTNFIRLQDKVCAALTLFPPCFSSSGRFGGDTRKLRSACPNRNIMVFTGPESAVETSQTRFSHCFSPLQYSWHQAGTNN